MQNDFQNRPVRLRELGQDCVRFQFDGLSIEAASTDTVAAALIAAGITAFRTTAVNANSRGPWCMMGVCFDCLVEIDGTANQQACMTLVRPGMQVKSMRGARSAQPASSA